MGDLFGRSFKGVWLTEEKGRRVGVLSPTKPVRRGAPGSPTRDSFNKSQTNDKWQLRILLITTNSNNVNRVPPTQRKGFRLSSRFAFTLAPSTFSLLSHFTHYSVRPSSVLRVLLKIITKNLQISSVLSRTFSPSRLSKMVCSYPCPTLLCVLPIHPS